MTAAAGSGGLACQEFILVHSVSSLPFSFKHYMGAEDADILAMAGKRGVLHCLEIPAISITQDGPTHIAEREEPYRASDKWPTSQLSYRSPLKRHTNGSISFMQPSA